MAKRVLITGGAGFLGHHLALRAAAEGFAVTVADDLSRGTHTVGPFDLLRVDVNDAAAAARLPGADLVVHCAALCGVDPCHRRPKRVLEDFHGTWNVAHHAVACGAERLVFFSSSEVYGPRAEWAREDDDLVLWGPEQPRTNYALSKLMGEALLRTLPIPSVAIRPFSVFGGDQIGPGVVRNFLGWALAGEPLLVHEPGTAVRSLCHVDDFTDGCWRVMTRPLRHAVYNLGNPANTLSVHAIAEAVVRATSSASPIRIVPATWPDKERVTPNIDRARDDLGFAPVISLDEGLRRIVADRIQR